MSTLIDVENTYFFSSAESLGAQNRTADGSKFQVLLDKEIQVPPSAIDCTIECRSANIWFTSPNIAAEYNNNKLHLEYNGVQFSLTVPDGLYSVSELNCTIQRLIANEYIPLTPGPPVVYNVVRFASNSISLSTVLSRQRILLKLIAGLGVLTDPALPDNIASVLGFTSPSSFPIPGNNNRTAIYDGAFFEAENVAQLNRINSYLLHGDIVNQGLSINNTYATIIAEIQLSVQPGKLLTYRPFLPYKIDGNHLKFGPKTLLTFYITDEQNRPIDTFGENYSFSIVVKYKVEAHTTGLKGFTPTFRHY
jgi:hypothetical protein